MTEYEKYLMKRINTDPKYAKDLGYANTAALYEDLLYSPEDAISKAMVYDASNGIDTASKPYSFITNRTRDLANVNTWLLDNFVPAFGNHMPRHNISSAVLPYYDAMRLHGVDRSLKDNDFWNSLSLEEKLALSSGYETKVNDIRNLWGGFGLLNTYELDEDRLLADLAELSNIKQFDLKAPNITDIERATAEALRPEYDAARQRALDTYTNISTALDEAQALTQQSYDDQFRNMNELYNRQASNLMSNQYLANAQTYDALQSDMRKSRQNALEAGASAGVRIAGNINALLSAQNKQSQTAMDTSNALAEMLLQQRNAASGLRSDYNQYMSDYKLNKANAKADYNSNLTDIDTNYRSEWRASSADDYDRAYERYNRAEEDYANQFEKLRSKGNSAASAYETYLYNNR